MLSEHDVLAKSALAKKALSPKGNIVKKAGKYVFALFNQQLSEAHLFHNYVRTSQVVEAARVLAKRMTLRGPEREIVLLAAWFSDAGYAECDQEPVSKSIAIAGQFLRERGYPEAQTQRVIGCLRATTSAYPPQGGEEEVVHDAYRLILADKKYLQKADLLRAELEKTCNQQYTDAGWLAYCLDYLTHNGYHTQYAQSHYGKGRAANLLEAERRYRKLQLAEEGQQAKERQRQQEAEKLSDREVEDLFKIASRNYVQLVAIADRKAGLLVNVTSLIISVVLAVLVRHLEETPQLIWPTVLLLGTCTVTMLFALLASRPPGRKPPGSVQADGQGFFFGSYDNTEAGFEHMSWETYQQQVSSLLTASRRQAFEEMFKEAYQVRKLLARKFGYLSVSYLIFLYGLLASILAYVAVMVSLSNFFPATL